jgi:hypothetical protein
MIALSAPIPQIWVITNLASALIRKSMNTRWRNSGEDKVLAVMSQQMVANCGHERSFSAKGFSQADLV